MPKSSIELHFAHARYNSLMTFTPRILIDPNGFVPRRFTRHSLSDVQVQRSTRVTSLAKHRDDGGTGARVAVVPFQPSSLPYETACPAHQPLDQAH